MLKRLAFFADRRGVAAIEFGFAAPVLFVLSVGIVDVGRMMWAKNTMENSARDGARYASVRGAETANPASAADVIAYVRNRAIGMRSTDMAVTVIWSPNAMSGNKVTVQIVYPFEFFLVGFLNLEPREIDATATLVVL